MLPMVETRVSVCVCETHPLVVEGLRSAFQQSRLFFLTGAAKSLEEAVRLAVADAPQVMIVDKNFGTTGVMDLTSRLRSTNGALPVVWGSALTEGEAVRFLKAGARGVLRKNSDVATVLECLETVARGGTWTDGTLFRDSIRDTGHGRTTLTPREQQVLELVEQGLRNKEIARELGIRPGTVKIHLKHVFEKTGVRGRYGLALSGLRNREEASILRF